MEFFKATSKNKIGKITFYTFEILALVCFIVCFILNIYNAAVTSSFMVFLSGFLNNVIWTAVLYGIGRAIDLLAYKLPAQEENSITKEK